MRNIDASDWLSDPSLQIVETKGRDAGNGASFTLFANQRKQIGIDEQLPACRVGVDDPAIRIEQADRNVQSVEHVGKIFQHRRDREQVALVIVDDENAGSLRSGGIHFHREEGVGGNQRHTYSAAVCANSSDGAGSRERLIHTRSSASSNSTSTGLAI